MPNGKGISAEEYKVFVEWLKKHKGLAGIVARSWAFSGAYIPKNDENITLHPVFRAYVEENNLQNQFPLPPEMRERVLTYTKEPFDYEPSLPSYKPSLFAPKKMSTDEYLALVWQMLQWKVENEGLPQIMAETMYVSERTAIQEKQTALTAETEWEFGAPVQGVAKELDLTSLDLFNDVVNWSKDYAQLAEKTRELVQKQEKEEQEQRNLFELSRVEGEYATRLARDKLAEQGAYAQLLGEEPRPIPLPEGIPTTPTIQPEIPQTTEGAYQAALQNLPYKMQQYFAGRYPEIYGEFESKFPGAREAWWNTINPPQTNVALWGLGAETNLALARNKVTQAARAEQIMASPEYEAFNPQTQQFIKATAEEQAQNWQNLARLEQETQAGAPTMPRYTGEPIRDPWEKYLEDKSFINQYMRLPQSVKGTYNWRFRPYTQWRVK